MKVDLCEAGVVDHKVTFIDFGIDEGEGGVRWSVVQEFVCLTRCGWTGKVVPSTAIFVVDCSVAHACDGGEQYACCDRV